MMTPEKLIAFARAEVGVAERPGADHEPRILRYFALAGAPQIVDDETAWCAAFVGAMLARCGMPILPPHRVLSARAWADYGSAVEIGQERPGDLVVSWRGSPSGWMGHVEIVVDRLADGALVTIGGNERNAVRQDRFSRTQQIAARRPPWRQPEPAPPAPDKPRGFWASLAAWFASLIERSYPK